jgi:hypothetical protein
MQFRKKPLRIEATQWFKNGDHPLDYSKDHKGFENGEMRTFTAQERREKAWEGDIVRYFRNPNFSGEAPCDVCGKAMNDHGWIDDARNGGAAHVVCPGDWIITGVNGEMYPCKPDIFDKTYEAVELT